MELAEIKRRMTDGLPYIASGDDPVLNTHNWHPQLEPKSFSKRHNLRLWVLVVGVQHMAACGRDGKGRSRYRTPSIASSAR